MNHFVKISRKQATHEITSKQSLMRKDVKSICNVDGEVITNDVSHYLKNVPAYTFNHTGAYPYIDDALCYMCTHFKEYIDRRDNDRESHYRLHKMPMNKFMEVAVGNASHCHKKNLIKELYKFVENTPFRCMYDGDNNTITLAQPIIIAMDITMEDRPAQIAGLINCSDATMQSISTISIDFYKPFWKDLLIGKYGRAWLSCPIRFYIKIHDNLSDIAWGFAHPNIDSTRFNALRVGIKAIQKGKYSHLLHNFRSALSYRQLYFYLNLHDNGISDRLDINGIDMATHCMPSLLRSNEKAELYARNKNEVREFVVQGIILFSLMGINNSMNGAKLVPTGVYYNTTNNVISIRVHRDLTKTPPPFEIDIRG